MGYSDNPNGSDFTIVTVVLQYSVFATVVFLYDYKGPPSVQVSVYKGSQWALFASL